MSSTVVDVRNVVFTQSTVSPEFSNGDSVHQLVEDLKSGKVSINDLPPIRAVQTKDGTLISLDNRRLYAFKEALKYKRNQDITIEVVDMVENEKEFERKWTTKCEGKGIRVKDGEPNWAIRTGPRGGEYYFDKDQCQVSVKKANRKQVAEIVAKDSKMLEEYVKRGLVSEQDAQQERESPGYLLAVIQSEISAGFRVNKDGRPIDPETGRFLKTEEALELGFSPVSAEKQHQQRMKQQHRQAEAERLRQQVKEEQRREEKIEQHRRQEKAEQQRLQAEEKRRQMEERRCQQIEEQRRREREEQQRLQAEENRRKMEEQRRRQVEAERCQQIEAEQQQRQLVESMMWRQQADVPRHSSSGSANGRELHTGPRGGTYYINGNGNKTYVKK